MVNIGRQTPTVAQKNYLNLVLCWIEAMEVIIEVVANEVHFYDALVVVSNKQNVRKYVI